MQVTTPEPTAPAARTHNPWVVLASTSLAVFAVFLDTTILFVAFPSIREQFSSTPPSTLSWILNAYTIVFAALLIPAGRLADRVGRRKTFLTAAVLFTVASMLCGLAPTVAVLVGARILQAVAAAALVPASLGASAANVPSPQDPGGRGDLGRCRGRRRCRRPHARRTGDREPRLALGVLHQPARRHRQLLPRSQGPSGMARIEPRSPTRSHRRRGAGLRSRTRRVRHRQDRPVGMGERQVHRLRTDRRRPHRVVRAALQQGRAIRSST